MSICSYMANSSADKVYDGIFRAYQGITAKGLAFELYRKWGIGAVRFARVGRTHGDSSEFWGEVLQEIRKLQHERESILDRDICFMRARNLQ